MKVLVVKDDKGKSAFGHVMPKKGFDEKGFSVDCLVKDIKWLGYFKVVFKSDNEPPSSNSPVRPSYVYP